MQVLLEIRRLVVESESESPVVVGRMGRGVLTFSGSMATSIGGIDAPRLLKRPSSMQRGG